MNDVPMLDLKAQYASIRAEIDAAIARVLESQHFILGPEVEALEREIAEYTGARHGVGVSSGTDALLIALMALGLGPGDEVLTTPFTFIATATSIARVGAKVRFVDINPETFNLDPGRVASALTARTKAIIPVHLYGQMMDVAALRAATRVPIVEDAAQSIGAEHEGRRAGSVGEVGCLSFFPSKNLGAFGDGGMVLTSDDALAERLRLLRNQGQRPKHHARVIGGNFRLDALQAAILRAKLPHLDGWSSARAHNAEIYRTLFGQSTLAVSTGALEGADVALPSAPSGRHVYNQFVVRCRERDRLKQHLAGRGIASEIYYPVPIHLQDAFADSTVPKGSFPEAERAAKETLALPIYPELAPAVIARIVSEIEAFFR